MAVVGQPRTPISTALDPGFGTRRRAHLDNDSQAGMNGVLVGFASARSGYSQDAAETVAACARNLRRDGFMACALLETHISLHTVEVR